MKGKIIILKRPRSISYYETNSADQHTQAFVRFENELIQIKPFITTTYEKGMVVTTERICSTTDSYVVKSKHLNIEKSDRRRGWNGFNWLAAALFGSLY